MTQEKLLPHFFERDAELVIFDVGSCDGASAIRYQNIFNNASLFAFEPVPSNYSIIKEKLKEIPNNQIEVFEIALSDQVGTHQMFVSSNRNHAQSQISAAGQSSSLLAPDKHLELYPWCSFENSLQVQTNTIRNFCLERNIKQIDFLHLDVQGAELMVLSGANDFIKNIKCIWVEVEHVQLYKNQPLRDEVENFLIKNNFILLHFRVGGYSGDQFWVRTEFLRSKKGVQNVLFFTVKSSIIRHPLSVFTNKVWRKFKLGLKSILGH